jgi:hypothetical protein
MTVRAFIKCVYLVFKSYSASVLYSTDMKYQRHNYFGSCQTEQKVVPETFKDVVTAHTIMFNIHQLRTGPIRCVCVSHDFHKKQQLF